MTKEYLLKVSKEGKTYYECRVLEPQQSEYLNSGKVLEHVQTMLPAWFVPGEFFGVTLNRNVCCAPHKDKKNVGETGIMYLGDFEGGALLLEDGRRFEERGVWHRYDGNKVLHWNEEIIAGTKYAVVIHNNTKQPLSFPYRKNYTIRNNAAEASQAIRAGHEER